MDERGSAKLDAKQTAEDRKQWYSDNKNTPLEKMSLESLIKLATIENGGISYSYDNITPESTDQDGVVTPEKVERERETLYKGNKENYAKVCEVIAENLIHCGESEMLKITKSMEHKDELNRNVMKIIEKKYNQTWEDMKELKEYYAKDSVKTEQLVTPLENAFGTSINAGEKILTTNRLIALRAYKDELNEKKGDLITKEGKPSSIADQLAASGDPFILKLLKGIAWSVLTLGGYAMYAVAQKVTGKPLAGVDSAAEGLAKRADSEILKTSRYKSLQHISTSTEAASTSESKQTPSGEQPQQPTHPVKLN